MKSKLAWAAILMAVFIGIVFYIMPKPIDMDLSKIGNGKKAVVFIYDPNLLVSNKQTAEINKARSLIGAEVVFLIAQTGDPRSEKFSKFYSARSSELLIFDGEGKLIDRMAALLTADELIRNLAAKK